MDLEATGYENILMCGIMLGLTKASTLLRMCGRYEVRVDPNGTRKSFPVCNAQSWALSLEVSKVATQL
jgi:hypothetical protein